MVKLEIDKGLSDRAVQRVKKVFHKQGNTRNYR